MAKRQAMIEPDMVKHEVQSENLNDVLLDEINTLKAAVAELLEDNKKRSEMVTDHEIRLYHLGDIAKPIPRTIANGIDLSTVFANVVSQVISNLIVNFYQQKNDDHSLRDHISVALRAGVITLEMINQRFEDSHKWII